MREMNDALIGKTPNRVKHVAWDMLMVQGTWAVWYLGIFFVINLVVHFLAAHLSGGDSNFLTFSLQSARVFMLIIGFIGGAGMTGSFVKMGVTRREFYFGNLMATLFLAAGLFTAGLILHGLLSGILPGYGFLEGLAFANLLEGFLMMLYFYFGGWLIALGFQRFSAVLGIIIILLLSGVVGIIQSLWNSTGNIGIFNIFFGVVNLEMLEVSSGIAAALTILIMAITLGIIYKINRRVPIEV